MMFDINVSWYTLRTAATRLRQPQGDTVDAFSNVRQDDHHCELVLDSTESSDTVRNKQQY